MEKPIEENKNGTNKPPRQNSIKDSLLLGAFKSLTVPASYLKAVPKYLQKTSKLKHYPKEQSVVLTHNANEIHIRRKGYENKLITDYDGLTTITAIFSECVKKYSHKHFLGTRDILKVNTVTTDDNKIITKLTLGKFQWESYGEIWSKIEAYCSFLKGLNIDSTNNIAIWADSCSDWLCVCIAMMFLKIKIVTIYSTLVDDAIIYAINITEVTGVFVDKNSYQRLLLLLPNLPHINKIFLLGPYADYDFSKTPTNIQVPIEYKIKKKIEYAPKISTKVDRSQKVTRMLKKSPMYFSLDEDYNFDETQLNNNGEQQVQSTHPVTGIERTSTLSTVVAGNIDENILNKKEFTSEDVIVENGSLTRDTTDDDLKQTINNTSVETNSITKLSVTDNNEDNGNPINDSNTFVQHEKNEYYDNTSIPTTIQCFHINQFVIEGKRSLKKNELQLETVDKDDIALIMFTSGSGGIPKGVYIQHKNIVASVGGGSFDRKIWYDIIYPAYLPLAHIFEFVTEMTVAANGGAIGYCNRLTLTDNSPMVEPGSKGDFVELKPTIGSFVPLLLERIKKAVVEKVHQRGKFASSILAYSVNHSRRMRNVSSDAPIVERIAFTKIRRLIGGNFRWAVCGGAPLSPLTQEFANISFGFPIIQGYGLTETCAGGTFGNLDDFSVDNTGPPFPAVELKLVPWEEGGYSPSDTPNPRGEIILGGECVTTGYYKNEEATKESFYTDPVTMQRWFKTGDIGEFCPNGTVKIIDRKKDIIKLKHGEYISLVRVETIVLQSQLVELCCALPNMNSDFVVLLMMPNQLALKSGLSQMNPDLDPNSTIEIIINDDKVKHFIQCDIVKYCNDGKLGKFEIPQKFVIVSEVWTPESGLLTPSMKVKRTEMRKFYNKFLD